MSAPPLRALLAPLLATVACASTGLGHTLPEPARSLQDEPGRWKRVPESARSAEWERLRSLGYVGGSIEDDRSGVTVISETIAQDQLNFFTSGHAPEAVLMDMQGKVLHRWRLAFDAVWPESSDAKRVGASWWRRAHLFENGDLLAIFEGLGVIKVDKDSKLIWARLNGAHHDLEVMPNGEIYILTRSIEKDLPGFEGSLILEDHLSILAPDGEEKRRISLLSAMQRSPFRAFMEERKHELGDIFHTNTIHALKGQIADRLPAFRSGNVLTSMNGLGVIAVLDLKSEEIVWARKRPPRGQHDPQVLENGHLLYFDNRENTGSSVVRELDPVSGNQVWKYRGSEEQPFYSKFCGSAQRLANGNTLITESDSGRAFEVDVDGRIVWEFYNPQRSGPEKEFIASLSEVLRIDAGYVKGWLGK